MKAQKITLFPGMAGLTRDIVEAMKKEGVQLLSVDLMVTQKCNFRCKYCYANGGPDKRHELSMKECKDIVDQCADLGVRVINITGGEPLVWKPCDWNSKSREAFFHLVEYIRRVFHDRKLPVNVVNFTDVALITNDLAARMADLELAMCGKLDSLNPEIQDELLNQKGGFMKMMKGYENLIAVGYGKKDMPPLSTNTVVTTKNYEDVPNVFRWSRSHGFKPFVIPVHVHGRARKYSGIMLEGRSVNRKNTLGPQDIKRLFYELARIDGEEFDIHWVPESPWVENKACSRHLGGIHVRADGYVMPCSEAPDVWALGHIRKQQFKEIVASEKVKKFRNIYSELHETAKCHPSNCELSAQRKCYGCRTRSYDDSGFDLDGAYDPSRCDPHTFFAGDPACWRGIPEQESLEK